MKLAKSLFFVIAVVSVAGCGGGGGGGGDKFFGGVYRVSLLQLDRE